MLKTKGHNGSSRSDIHLLSEGPPCATLCLSLHTRQIVRANSTSGSMKESPTLKPCAQQQVKIPLVGYREGKYTITGKSDIAAPRHQTICTQIFRFQMTRVEVTGPWEIRTVLTKQNINFSCQRGVMVMLTVVIVCLDFQKCTLLSHFKGKKKKTATFPFPGM